MSTSSDCNIIITCLSEEQQGWDENMNKSFHEDSDPEEVIGHGKNVLKDNKNITIWVSEDENVTTFAEEHTELMENMDKSVDTNLNDNSDPKVVSGNEIDLLTGNEEVAI